jgi:hypothetical protein
MAGTYTANRGASPQFDNTVAPSGNTMGSTESGGMAKYKWYIIAAVGGIAIILYIRSKSATASATTGAVAPNPTGGTGTSTPDQTALDSINSLLGQIITNTTAGAPGTGTPPPNTTPTTGAFQGAGYLPPDASGFQTSAQGNFQWIQSTAQAQSLIQSGQKVYYQPQQGIFVPWDVQLGLPGNTALFSSTPYSGPAPTPAPKA